MNKKIVMLIGRGESSTFMYNSLKTDFEIIAVIEESPVKRRKFLKRRVKKLGFVKVLGQILFQVFVPKILKKKSHFRIEQIKKNYSLDATSIPQSLQTCVNSVNSSACIQLLNKLNPDLIIVNGTRIISKNVLASTSAIFVNTHAGITPEYRGVHGGYWAMAKNDLKNCGVTVHLIDSGIDTGGVLYQKTILPSAQDNFVTYTYLQIGEGVQLMQAAVTDFLSGNLSIKNKERGKSQLWSHPTLWTYLWNWVMKGVH